MYDVAIPWDLFLLLMSSALVGSGLWAGARKLLRRWPGSGLPGQPRAHLVQPVARQLSFRVDTNGDTLQGRVNGWPVALHRSGPLRSSAGHWLLRLHAIKVPAGVPATPSPPPPFPVRREGAHLVSIVPLAEESRLSEQLQHMARMATRLQNRLSPASHDSDPLHPICTALGLSADGVLPRWEGRWKGRRLVVERDVPAETVQVHLEVQLDLPPGFQLAHRDLLEASDSCIPIPPHATTTEASAHALGATVTHRGTQWIQELLCTPGAWSTAVLSLLRVRRAQVLGSEVRLVRAVPTWEFAPEATLEAGCTLARALEEAAAHGWLALARAHGLQATTTLSAGLAVLTGDWSDFRVDLRRCAGDGAVRIEATPTRTVLAHGLCILPGEGQGSPTGNPLLDLAISVRATEALHPDDLARLPPEALLPLLLDEAETTIREMGLTIVLAPYSPTSQISEVLTDLQTLLPTLPRTRLT